MLLILNGMPFRYDYEEVDSKAGDEVMKVVTELQQNAVGQRWGDFEIALADNFSYHDPVDGSVTKNQVRKFGISWLRNFATHQGLRFVFTDGSRVVFRLSGTGSQGATVRVYFEKYEPVGSKELELETQVALKPLIELALTKSRLREITGRKEPTVIT